MKISLQKNNIISLVIFVGISTSILEVSDSNAEDNNLTEPQAKVHYTFEVLKHLRWPNDNELSEFRIALIGVDFALEKAFLMKRNTKVRGKSIHIVVKENLDVNLENYSVIFINQRVRALNQKIFPQVIDSLIITVGRVKKIEQMVSLVIYRNNMEIKLNRENLAARGFEISTNLLEFAGTKEDLGEQLRDKELYLKELLQQEKSKEENIIKLNKTLLQNQLSLESAENRLKKNHAIMAGNNKRLETLNIRIKKTQVDLEVNRSDLQKQKIELNEKQNKIITKEETVVRLQRGIDKSESVLAKQLAKIQQQNTEIENKQNTIIEQRGWLYLIITISLIFFLMIYFLLKSNRLRNKANRELALLNSRLFELATVDGLTSLFNRRYFLESAQKELLRQKRHDFQSALLMIDIDNFKQVNDTYGHAAGDRVILSVAKALQVGMRNYDIVGRLGGEEYAMMLLDCDLSAAIEIAQRLCLQVKQQVIQFENLAIGVTISIGLSQLDVDDRQVEQALGRADKALYSAKRNGKNQVVIYTQE